jgi:hypothetical protein
VQSERVYGLDLQGASSWREFSLCLNKILEAVLLSPSPDLAPVDAGMLAVAIM